MMHEELKSQLKRPERNDLENAEKMRSIHFENLKNIKNKPPNYTEEIIKLMAMKM